MSQFLLSAGLRLEITEDTDRVIKSQSLSFRLCVHAILKLFALYLTSGKVGSSVVNVCQAVMV